MIYESISAFVGSKTTHADRITAIDALIDAMLLTLADATNGMNPTVEEYQLDDGQMKIRTRYRSISDVEAGIKSLEKLKQMYVNRYNGHVSVLRDVRGLS
ncbi:hypothetical protein [Muricauda sp. MAR_2010_75]|uniref:hypothetical protein n=1 Tax=Allomuricauda sp. MAR_2010_75 TaxID=1250232 RepID=UPI00055F6194|nr:hypothetical protein [Muricauda sp. MAR_2010_75]